jgi:hypothetical protein
MTESDKGFGQSNGPKAEQIQNSTENLQNQTNENGELKLDLNLDHVAIIKREYKKVKRYMRSPIYEVRVMNGTEKVVNELLDKYYKEETSNSDEDV